MERVRERDTSLAATVPTWARLEYTPNASQPTVFTELSYGTGTTLEGDDVFEHTTDVVSPDFKRRIANGEVINNPYLHYTTTDVWPGAVNFDWLAKAPSSGRWYRWSGYAMGAYPALDAWDDADFTAEMDAARTSAADQAVTSAFANINESEMLALAAAAESGATVDSLVSILQRVFRIARSLRKFDAKALAKEISPKELSKRYLEARYAIRPLMYDAANLIVGLEKARQPIRRTYRGSAKTSAQMSLPTVPAAMSITEVKYDMTETRAYSCVARAGVLCEVDIDDVTVFGIDKLAETVWELIPFSFIIDWFCNIGDTIAALTPNAGVEQRASWRVLRETLTVTQTFHSPDGSNPAYTDISCNADEFQRKWTHCVTSRAIDPQVSVFPRVDINLDGWKLADLVLIGRQLLM